MTAGWVAAGVRARAMTARCLRPDLIRDLAVRPSLGSALADLEPTQYGRGLRSVTALAEAERAVNATALWNLRVLAGWAPRPGVAVLRALLGGFEIGNVIDRLQGASGGAGAPPYKLGALATAWPRLARAVDTVDLRRVLAASPWGDPGLDTAEGIETAMRASLYDRVASVVPDAAGWATAATILLLARKQVLEGRDLPYATRLSASRVVGRAATEATTVEALAASAPSDARWVLAGVSGPEDLWKAELVWWRRVVSEGSELSRRPIAGPGALVGAVALVTGDAWRVRAALELADRRGWGGRELVDAILA